MINKVTIYYIVNGVTKTLIVKFSDNDYLQKEIMQASFVSLNFSLPKYIELPIGSWISIDNETYYLLDLCQPTKHNSENFDYSLTFYDSVGMLNNWIIQDYTDNRIKFSLTGKPLDFLNQIVKSCNKHINNGEQEFSVGYYEDASEKLISFENTFISEALNSVANAFNTEWYVTSDRKICLKKLENTPNNIVTIKYGSGFGIKPNIERRNSDQRKIDKIFVQGGDRNIVQTKYGSQYLLLPKNKNIYYDGTNFHSTITNTADRKYVSDNDGLSIKGQDYDKNVIHSEIGFDGSNIYPSRIGKITKITWSPNNSNSEYNSYEEADSHNGADDKGNVWCNIYDFSIPEDLDYSDENYRAEGTETISFISGRLAGRNIEVSTYIHSSREFKLMRITDGGVNMPNNTFAPDINDEYIVFGMQMPDNYVDSASLEMMKEAIKQMYKYEFEQVLFSLPIDEIWYRQSGKQFNVGDNVNYVDDDFAKSGLKIRITQIRQYLLNPYKIEITLSNCPIEQTIKQQIKDFWNFKDNFDSLVTDRLDFYDKTGNGSDKGSSFNNKCWIVLPFTPYYKNDEWIVANDTTIGNIKFKSGVTYHCKKTRLRGNFIATDWIPKSLFDYDKFDNRPKINGTTLTGDRSLLTQHNFDKFISEEFNPLSFHTDKLFLDDDTLQFRFIKSTTDKTEVEDTITWDNTTKQLSVGASVIQHLTLGITTLSLKYRGIYKIWSIPAFVSDALTDEENAGITYYLYAKCLLTGNSGSFILTNEKIKNTTENGYIYLLIGVLNSEFNNDRLFIRLYGYAPVSPARVNPTAIISNDGNTYLDLDNGAFSTSGQRRTKFTEIVLKGGIIETLDLSRWSYLRLNTDSKNTVMVALPPKDVDNLNCTLFNSSKNSIDIYPANPRDESVQKLCTLPPQGMCQCVNIDGEWVLSNSNGIARQNEETQQIIDIDERTTYKRIIHGFGKKPEIKVINDKGEKCFAQILFVDDNTIEVIMNKAINGQIIIN